MASVVNVAFEPVGDDQTLMSIEHSRLLPPEEFESFDNGWTLTFDQLAGIAGRGMTRCIPSEVCVGLSMP